VEAAWFAFMNPCEGLPGSQAVIVLANIRPCGFASLLFSKFALIELLSTNFSSHRAITTRFRPSFFALYNAESALENTSRKYSFGSSKLKSSLDSERTPMLIVT
jgi:hypothetical protein